MKKTVINLLFVLPLLCSCNSFLEYKDKDKVIPNKLSHYDELVFGEIMMPETSSVLCNLDIMTDDAGSFVKPDLSTWSTDGRITYFSWYTWAEEPQLDKIGEKHQDLAWSFFYHKILMCNIVEHDLADFEDDDSGIRQRLLGEVRFMRALSYFYLVNMYGAPYQDAAQAKTAMGVPINKEAGIYATLYTRSSLQAVYDLMEKDLLDAKVNLQQGENKHSVFRPNIDVVNLFLSRIYLFQKRYADVIRIATEVIATSGASVEPLNNIISNTVLYHKSNPGILFTWGKDGDQGPFYSTLWNDGKYVISNSLEQLYQPYDQRPLSFFDQRYSRKTKVDELYRRCYRFEEVLLNRAEAYIEEGKEWGKGMDDVNSLRSERISRNWQIETQSREEALQIYRNERRRELCFEDIRWFDIRRWGLEVEHRYEDFQNSASYRLFKLPANSPNYILPIPLDEQDINDKIERPKRVDCEVKG